MTYYTIQASSIKSPKTLDIASTARKTKRCMFDSIVKNGLSVCDFFEEEKEFDFIWDTKTKSYKFVNPKGECFGYVSFKLDEAKNKAKAKDFYIQNKF